MMVNKRIITFLLIAVALFTGYYIMFYNYDEMVINRLLVDKRSVNNRLIVSRINEILFREYEPVEVELVPTGPYYSIEVTLEDTSYTIGVWPHLIHVVNNNLTQNLKPKGDTIQGSQYSIIDIKPLNFYRFDQESFKELQKLIEPLFKNTK